MKTSSGDHTRIIHAGIQTGGVTTAPAYRPLPLDSGIVINSPNVTVVLLWARIGLVLSNYHRSLEEILASKE